MAVFDNQETQFTVLDPYNEVRASNSKYNDIEDKANEKFLKVLTKKHLNTIDMISKVFIVPHQETVGILSKNEINLVVKFPPQIPAQLNQYDCGVFMLEFAKYLCLGSQFTFSCKDMNFFRQEIKEELVMNKIIKKTLEKHSEEHLASFPLLIFSFKNPPRKNLCFSNAAISLVLNIPVLRQKMCQITTNELKEENKLLEELHRIANLPKFTNTSTARFRYLTKKMCIEARKSTQNFSNNQQHDVGEFLCSLLEHIFKDSKILQNFDEKMFGGLWQTSLVCLNCCNSEELGIQKIPEIIPLDLSGENLQDCLDNFFQADVIERNCSHCPAIISRKKTETVIEPNTMIFQINRYEYDREENRIIKKHNKLTCPSTLTLKSGSSYSLCSIINHIGASPDAGHYNIIVYNEKKDKYVLLDDLNIDLNCVIDDSMKKTHYLVTYYKNE